MRNAGSRFARRLGFTLLALSPLAASAQPLPAGCEPRELSTLPLTFRDDAVPVTEVRIDGKPVPALIDTGAQQATSLDRKTLEEFGIKVNLSDSNYVGVQVANARIDHIALGPIEYKKAWFVVDDLQKDGVGAKIGANYLFRTDVELALAQGYLKFFKPTGCLRASLAYWDRSTPSAPFQVHPLRKDLRPWFKVRINGQDINAVISTVTTHSYMDLFTAKRMGLTPESPGATREGSVKSWYDREQAVWKVPVPRMSIGELDITNFDLRLMNMDISGEMLVLGTDFLRRHRVYVAMSQNRIYFSPVNPAPAAQVAPAAAGADASQARTPMSSP
ncbi:retroviral-like aspartic protease family protein [Massilia consociata]|uniref:Retroviral-like aspartic protease family protein n=1 Tax=Massilia consociata TaxID=760117 RepID=A0ABV6FGE6_9BURK